MKKRMFLMLIAVAVFLTALGLVKYNQIQTAIAEGHRTHHRRRR